MSKAKKQYSAAEIEEIKRLVGKIVKRGKFAELEILDAMTRKRPPLVIEDVSEFVLMPDGVLTGHATVRGEGRDRRVRLTKAAAARLHAVLVKALLKDGTLKVSALRQEES